MLVLSRKIGESIVIRDDIRVVLVSMDGSKCRLGIVAPPDVPVHRQEIHDKIKAREEFTLAFTGRGTTNNAFADELRAAGADTFSGRHLILDFVNVRMVGSVELGTLVSLHKRLTSRGVGLSLIHLDANVREVFGVTRLDTILTITEDRATVGGSSP